MKFEKGSTTKLKAEEGSTTLIKVKEGSTMNMKVNEGSTTLHTTSHKWKYLKWHHFAGKDPTVPDTTGSFLT